MAMDYNYAQIQPNPNPNSEYPVLQTYNQSINYSQNLVPNPYQPSNVNSHSALLPPPQPRPPGVDPPYVPSPMAVNYAPQPIGFEARQGAEAAAAPSVLPYYPDPNMGLPAPVPPFGTAPYAAGVSTPIPTTQPLKRYVWKKVLKKTKVVQSVWCDVCKIDCNSKDVLDQHKLGKKHQKNLQKLEAKIPTVSAPIIAEPLTSIAFAAPPASIISSTSLPVPTPPPPAAASIDEPAIGPQENLMQSKPKSKKSRKKAAARTEDLETKRRKVLEGGAAADAVRACNICNVVCNSDTVFNYHIAGQKHASMAKKQTSIPGVASVV